MAGGLAVAVVVVAGGAIAWLTSGSDDPAPPLSESVAVPSSAAASTSSSTTVSSPPPSSATPVAAGGECKTSTSPGLVTGNGPGDQNSGPGAILAFEHAYYVDRDAKRAVGLAAKGSKLRNAEALQKGIDGTPKDLTHCVRISSGDSPTTWLVEISTSSPSAGTETFSQRITTAAEGGRHGIVSIEKASKP